MVSQIERRACPPSFAATVLLLTTKEGAEAKRSSSMRSFSQDQEVPRYGQWSADGHPRSQTTSAAGWDDGSTLRRAVKEVEELLLAHRPVATHWRGNSSHFSMLLEDASWVHCNLRATSGDDIQWLCTDRSEATIIPDKLISADMDQMCHLLLTLSRTGVLQVYDLKASAVEAIHGATVAMDMRTRLASAKVASLSVGEGVRSVQLNCSADMAMVLCDSAVVVYRVRQERDAKGSKGKGPSLVCAIQQPMLVKDVVQCRFSHRLPNVVILTSAPNAPAPPTLGLPGATRGGGSKEHKVPPAAEMGQYIVSRGKISAVRQMAISAVDLPGGATAAEWDLEESQLVVGSREGHLVLYDVARGVLRRVHFPDKGKVKLIRWHPTGAFLLVGFGDGSVAAVDAALNTLWFAFEGMGLGQPCLSFTDMLGFDCQVALVEFYGAGKGQGRNMDAVAGLHAGELTYTLWERAVVVMERGPLAVVNLTMGALSQGKLRVREIVAQHLNNGDIRQAISLVSVCNNESEKQCALEIILNQAMRRWTAPSLPSRFPLQETMWSILDLSNVPRGAAFVEHWRNLWRRVGQLLLRFNQLEAAFSLAHRIQGVELLQDIFVHATRMGDTRVAEAVRVTLSEEQQRVKLAPPAKVSPPRPLQKLPSPASPPVVEPWAEVARELLPSLAEMAAVEAMLAEVKPNEPLTPEEEWHLLSKSDIVTLGTRLEASGQLDQAVKLYTLHNMTLARTRLLSLMSMHNGFTTLHEDMGGDEENPDDLNEDDNRVADAPSLRQPESQEDDRAAAVS